MQAFSIDLLNKVSNYEFYKELAIEVKAHIIYNSYRSIMIDDGEDLKEIFAEARAIYFAMLHGAITSHQAKLRVAPFLRHINATVRHIAKEHKVKPTYITFFDLGKTL